MRILFFCGALAAGEYAASFVPECAEAWPFVAGLAVFVVLLGYGLGIRGWPFAATFVLGAALFLSASVASERLYREKPWLRACPMRDRCVTVAGAGRLSSVRFDLSRRVAIGLGHDREVASLNRAILLGERRGLPPRVKRAFVESGTMHVFAISGLHVMTVAHVLIVCLSLLFVPRRFAGFAALPLLWGYVALIGWSPSAIRAAGMATFHVLALLFWRRPNLLRSWALTFLAVHLLDPLLIVNVGNVLSFTVMLAIAGAVEWGRLMRRRVPSVAIGVLVWAVGVPIAAHVFGRVTPGAILANLVLIGAVEQVVVFGTIGVAVSFVSTTFAAHVNNLSALCTRAMVLVSESVSRLPGANLEVGHWSIPQCIEWYVLLALVFWVVHSVGRRRGWRPDMV